MSGKNKTEARVRRRASIRKRLSGTPSRPRLAVFRSTNHIYAQVIDDTSGQTLCATSTLSKELRGELEGKNKKEQAKLVGKAVAKLCLAREIAQVAFDRGGFIYHGRIAALAEGAREAGLVF